jgi:hypothetical protein
MPRFSKLAALAPFFLALACGDANKAPAQAAVQAAEAALATLGPDAAKYAPEGVAAAQKGLAAAKELMGTKEYEGALKAASGVPAKVKEAAAAAAAKKEELVKAWSGASAEVSASVSAIQERLAALHRGKKLPAGITKETLAKADEGLASIQSGLAKLSEDFKGGKIAEAIAGAKDLQAKGAEITKSLDVK